MSTGPVRKRSAKAVTAAAVVDSKHHITIKEMERDSTPAVALDTDGTTVDVELGFNENLGDFNHGKVFVRVSIPCTKDTIQSAAKFAYRHADEILTDVREQFIGGAQ